MKKEIGYEDIDQARKTLGLEEKESIKNIKKKYRKLALKYHPDKCKSGQREECEKKIKSINQAYNIIMDYCFKYEISFSLEMVRKVEDGEYIKHHREKFYHRWW